MARKFIGNDDFRGWLAAKGLRGTLKHTGNDGKIDRAKVNRLGGEGHLHSWMPGHADEVQAEVDQLYRQWQAEGASQPNPPSGSQTRQVYRGGGRRGGGRRRGGGSGGGSGGGYDPAKAARKAQARAAIDATQKAIDSLGTEEAVGKKNIDDQYGSVIAKYDKETTRNKAEYQENVVTNTKNLAKNKQNALLAGAQGARGLRGTLSALGALSTDGLKLANEAVASSVNQDIGNAADTFADNASKQDKAWKNYQEDDEDRRKEAQTIRDNQKTALEGKIAEKKQNFFQKMAELYGIAEDNGKVSSYLGQAGGLNNVIANKGRVSAPALTAKAAAFTPGALETYLAGAGDMTVSAQSGDSTGGNLFGQGNSILAGRRKNLKDEEEYRK